MDVPSNSSKTLDGFYNELRRKYPDAFTLAADLGRRNGSLQKLPRLEKTPSPVLGFPPNSSNVASPQRWSPDSFLSKVKYQKTHNEQRKEVEKPKQSGNALIIKDQAIPLPAWSRNDYLEAQNGALFHLPTLRTQVEQNKVELKNRLNPSKTETTQSAAVQTSNSVQAKTSSDYTTSKSTNDYPITQTTSDHTTRKTSRDYTTIKPTNDYTTTQTASDHSTWNTSRDYTTIKPTKDYNTTQTTNDHSTWNTSRDYTTIKPTNDYTTTQTTSDHTTWKTSRDYTTIKPTKDYTTTQTTSDHTTLKTSRDYTTIKPTKDYNTTQTTSDHSTWNTSRDYTTIKPTNDYTTTQTTSDHTTWKTSRDYTTIKPTNDYTTTQTTSDHTTWKTSRDYATIKPTIDYTTTQTTGDHTTWKTSKDYTTIKPTNDYTTTQITSDHTTWKTSRDYTTIKPTNDYTTTQTTGDHTTWKTSRDYTTIKPTNDYTTTQTTSDHTTRKTSKDYSTTKPTNDYTTTQTTNDYTLSKIINNYITTKPINVHTITTTKSTNNYTTTKTMDDYTPRKTSRDYTTTKPINDCTTMTAKTINYYTAPKSSNDDTTTTKSSKDYTTTQTFRDYTTTKSTTEFPTTGESPPSRSSASGIKSDPLGTIMKELLPNKPSRLMKDLPKTTNRLPNNGGFVSDSDSGVSVCAPIKVFRTKIRSPQAPPASRDIIKKFSTKPKRSSEPVKADHSLVRENVTQIVQKGNNPVTRYSKSSINFNEKIPQRLPKARVHFEDESKEDAEFRYQERYLLEKMKTAKTSPNISPGPEIKLMERNAKSDTNKTSTSPFKEGERPKSPDYQTMTLPQRRQPFPPNVAKKVLIDIPRGGLPSRRVPQRWISPVMRDIKNTQLSTRNVTSLDGITMSFPNSNNEWGEQGQNITAIKEDERGHHSHSSLETLGSGTTEDSSDVTIMKMEWVDSSSSIGSGSRSRSSSQNRDLDLDHTSHNKATETSFYSKVRRSLRLKKKESSERGSCHQDFIPKNAKDIVKDHSSYSSVQIDEGVGGKSSPHGAAIRRLPNQTAANARLPSRSGGVNRTMKDVMGDAEQRGSEKTPPIKAPYSPMRMMQSLLKRGRAKDYMVRVPSPPPKETSVHSGRYRKDQASGGLVAVRSDSSRLVELDRPKMGFSGLYLTKKNQNGYSGLYVVQLSRAFTSSFPLGILEVGDEILEINRLQAKDLRLDEIYTLLEESSCVLLRVSRNLSASAYGPVL
ncbi:uncharacterized protein ACNLHF_000188 [Anomaloglossus baeobatrachus]